MRQEQGLLFPAVPTRKKMCYQDRLIAGVLWAHDNAWAASQVTPVVTTLSASAGHIRDAGLIPGSGRSPGGGDGNALQYFCLENPMDRGVWWATVHGVAQSQTWLKRLSTMHNNAWIPKHIHAHTLIRSGLQCFNNYCHLHGQKSNV